MRILNLDPIKRGAAQPFVSNGDMAALPIVMPPEEVRDAFRTTGLPLLHRQEANVTECISLAELRDFLLPKLMSAELRVREAEKMVEAVL
jgi:type I restriction enzyme S subunit